VLHSQIPGYNRAYNRGARLEESWRELPFLGDRVTEKIRSLEVRLITLRMFLQLCRARSRFLCGGTIRPQDVTLFLWRISPSYSPGDKSARLSIAQKVASDWPDAKCWKRAIDRYLDRMFLDKPPTSGGKSESDACFAAAMIHEIASAYGWDADSILDTPMPALFQYVRQIQRDRMSKYGKDLPRFNPLRSRFTKKVVDRHRKKNATPDQSKKA